LINKESPNEGRTGIAPSQTRASIVNIGSSASLCAWPTLTAYTASKHAVLGLTRSWSMDWAHKGVRVNLVAPGGTDTPLARAQLADTEGRGQALTEGLVMIPLGRLGLPEEQADACVFLLDDGSSYITGQVIPVNGGFP
jgi:NAD(P)-dependent dehydrogenase (short-subunit alcohol dehydrogenase family)